MKDTVTIPEGLRGRPTSSASSPRRPKFNAGDFEKVLDDPDAARAARLRRGQPGGLPLPGDLRLRPERRPEDDAHGDGRPLGAGRRRTPTSRRAPRELGYTPAELMTIASLVEAEGRGEDMPKIARVIYNRLENPGNASTNGLLQIDATVNYALDRKLGGRAADQDRRSTTDSPYNTYKHPGLPPAPIEAPGRRGDRGGRAPGGRRLVLLRHGQPARPARPSSPTTYDEFLRYQDELRRVLRDRVRPAAEPSADEVRGPGRPDRPLAVAGAAPGRRTPRRAATGTYDAGPGRRRRARRLRRRASTRTGAGCR